ncbi:Alpha/Beta hydrolase protein [Penicillium malachiteum]|uniref:Alpha/Beta hydrolase protein n=1 Tax=Penicillium malachiteum TaxID=1324776 RepID=UPI002548C374|nr:Alpha/Beta hydrolase protein [Penicillium malachiteum]KAJ5736709.1 Alpha/Beta hydrolase protein [Penicillium malachiteum]
MTTRSLSELATGRVPLAFELLRAKSPQGSATQKSPILFLHGFLGSKRENRHVSRLLAKDLTRDVYTLDLRNHGDSGHHPLHTYPEMALDVKCFIQTHNLQRPTVIGHSMGAKTAMTLALGSPDLVSNVVAVDNGPIELALVPDFEKYLDAMAEIHSKQVPTHLEADKILRETVTVSTRSVLSDEIKLLTSRTLQDASVRLWLLSNFIKEKESPFLKLRLSVDILRGALGPLGMFPYKPGSATFSNPVLFLRGLQSHYIPENAFPLMNTLFPRSETVNIDCGHWIVQEKPEEFRQGMIYLVSQMIRH